MKVEQTVTSKNKATHSDTKQILTASPWRTGGEHRDAPRLHGWRLPSRTWNHWTSPWTKQLTWLRIVHSGECLVVYVWRWALIAVHARN